MTTNFRFKNALKLSAIALTFITASCAEEDNIFNDENAVDDAAIINTSNISAKAINCTTGKSNPDRYVSGPSNPTLPGRIDDTTCYADYEEDNINGTTTGIFRIKVGSEHIKQNGRQPRIEKFFTRVKGKKLDQFHKIEGYVTIKRVGYDKNDGTPKYTSLADNSGTYIFQVKGNHKDGPGDPAICLFVAKPVVNSRGIQTSYIIYREQVTERTNTGTGKRKLIEVATVPKNKRFKISCKVGYRKRNNREELFVSTTIDGQSKTFIVPSPELTEDYGIRYGAYRCKAGQAEILWDNVKESRKG